MAAISGNPHLSQIQQLLLPDREAIEFRDLLDKTIQELGLEEENWNSKGWSKLASHLPQSYLNSVFEFQGEVIDLFRLGSTPALNIDWINEMIDMDPRLSRMPREDALHTLMRIFPKYYEFIRENSPKELEQIQEEYTRRLSGLPYGRPPLYFTALAGPLSFCILLKNIHELPDLLEHLQTTALKQEGGKVCIRNKNHWDRPDPSLLRFAHVYLPKYGLIEFQIINRKTDQAALFP